MYEPGLTQVFAYTEKKSGKRTNFNIDAIVRNVAQFLHDNRKLPSGVHDCSFKITDELIESVKEFGGVEQTHLSKIPPNVWFAPILVAEYGEHHVIIDGNHRILKLHEFGHKLVKALVLEERFWDKHTVSDHQIKTAYN